ERSVHFELVCSEGTPRLRRQRRWKGGQWWIRRSRHRRLRAPPSTTEALRLPRITRRAMGCTRQRRRCRDRLDSTCPPPKRLPPLRSPPPPPSGFGFGAPDDDDAPPPDDPEEPLWDGLPVSSEPAGSPVGSLPRFSSGGGATGGRGWGLRLGLSVSPA